VPRVAGLERVSWRVIVALALLLLAAAAAAVYVGSQPRRLPALIEPAANGLIAYASGGDIYVGDAATGETKAVVAGPDVDSGPIFSPDGTRIAFMRGDPWTEEASVLVVRADGSDGRVIVPAGFSRRGLGFAWTPDSSSLVVNHDGFPPATPYFDGELSLFDASGAAGPRLLTPPLPILPGTDYMGPYAQVAPMFRPPSGDRILSTARDAPRRGPRPSTVIDVLDADLARVSQLSPGEALADLGPYHVGSPSWSPDGSMTTVELIRTDSSGTQGLGRLGWFVMDADGSDVRQLGPDDAGSSAWSPDGSQIAFERCSQHTDGPGSVIVLVSVASGAERVLEAASVETKTEGSAPYPRPTTSEPLCGWYSGPTGRAWDYEGWSWSPDGRSIVFLETHGERPKVVNVQTGEAAELPWEADSAPSWRIPSTGGG
jgi:Tol biopolymer transport system component